MMNFARRCTLLFESICVSDGVVQNIFFHIKRMKNSVEKLKFNPFFAIDDSLKKSSLGQAGLIKVKLVYSKSGEFVNCETTKYTPKNIKSIKFIQSDINYNKKWLNRDEINSLYDKCKDFDEILIVKNGFITDTGIANVAILLDNVWLTPNNPLLAGTCRARLLENGFLKLADIDIDMVLKAKGFAVLNAMTGFRKLENIIFKV